MTDSTLIQSLEAFVDGDKPVIALTTVSSDAVPSTVLAPEIFFSNEGKILYREYLESSATNRNLLHALWFGRHVVVALATGVKAINVVGTPTHSHVAGALFQQHYEAAQALIPDADLAAVWEIRIDEVTDVSPDILRRGQDVERPFFRHLDRLVEVSG